MVGKLKIKLRIEGGGWVKGYLLSLTTVSGELNHRFGTHCRSKAKPSWRKDKRETFIHIKRVRGACKKVNSWKRNTKKYELVSEVRNKMIRSDTDRNQADRVQHWYWGRNPTLNHLNNLYLGAKNMHKVSRKERLYKRRHTLFKGWPTSF